MTSVFLYGPMAWPPLLEAIMGPGAAPEHSAAARLEDHALMAPPGQFFARLQSGGAGVAGRLLTGVPEPLLDRLAYFAAGFEARARMAPVLRDGQSTAAQVFFPADQSAIGGPDWDADTWARDWGALAVHAAQEIAQHRTKITVENLPRHMPMILMRAEARVAAQASVPTQVRSDTAADSIDVQSRQNMHSGFFLTRAYQLRHPQFDGTTSPLVTREVFVATDAAIVLPYDAKTDRVLLVEQFRMGPFGRGDPKPWVLEPVAGRVDPGEAPEVTARRECEEEAGLRLKTLEHIASYYCSPGCSTEYFHCYLGLCDLPVLSIGQGGLPSEDEDIRTHVLPFDDAFALVSSGEADNGPLILSLIWLAAERKRLRASA